MRATCNNINGDWVSKKGWVKDLRLMIYEGERDLLFQLINPKS
jgi:hypothetical protein